MTTIRQTLLNCETRGFKPTEGKIPVQSDLKKITSLIGLTYLNYIYQNDLSNKHFCESMLFMKSQTANFDEDKNPYVRLFDIENSKQTIQILEDIQLSFDYAIDRTILPEEKVQNSVNKINKVIGVR
jgi:hypothetical protein